MGLELIKEAVLELARANPKGITIAGTASVLGLRSDFGGGANDYPGYSILGLLMREGRIRRVAGRRRHVATVKGAAHQDVKRVGHTMELGPGGRRGQ